MAIIGIDLGTTNSCLALIEGDVPFIVPNEEGSNTTPSFVVVDNDNSKVAGAVAKRQSATSPLNSIFAVKRLIGRKYKSSEVQRMKESVPYNIIPSKSGDAYVEFEGNFISPQEISSAILLKMKEIAEKHLGFKVTDAVITTPAYFNEMQRQAIKDAGKIAGLNVRRIINEPTAAALAYGLDKADSRVIVVFDLGGGTFDLTVLEIVNNVFEVKSTSGDTFLGGEDFDQRLAEFIIDEFKKENGIDLSNDKIAIHRIKEASEKAKKELSLSFETKINLPFMAGNSSSSKHIDIDITREQFEGLVSDLIEKLEKPSNQALEDSGFSKNEIDEVLLVGGMTRMPKVKEKVEEIFGKSPKTKIDPEEVVALGAAIQGGILEGKIKEITFLDVVPLSLGLETKGGMFTRIIERNTTVPTKESKIFTTAFDNQSLVRIRVFQGEREMVKDNILLGSFSLIDIPPAPKGLPQIEVSFEIDIDGILNVTAIDLGTREQQKIQIRDSGKLSEIEIERIISKSEEMAKLDKKKKELVLLRNQAQGLLYSVDKTLKSCSGRITDDLKVNIETGIDNLKKVLDLDEYLAIREAYDSLQENCHKLAESIYLESQT